MTGGGFAVETLDLSDPGGPSPPPPFPPPHLPGYRLERELGRGAMGAVYQALDLKSGRPVAVKVSSSIATDELDRLAHEGELQRQLRHPAVPRVHASGCLLDGRGYLVQTLVRGARTLDQAAASVDWLQKVEWMATAAEALAVAHGRCVCHGDIKPANLLVDDRGALFIVDWGVSRLAACASSSPAELPDALQDFVRELDGWIQGTLPYMAPEQLHGTQSPAADVYSLALVLCELLDGSHPLEALMHDAALLTERIHRGAPPAVSDHHPEPLPDLLRRCLQKDPTWRPPSQEVARALRRLARNERRERALARCATSRPPGE